MNNSQKNANDADAQIKRREQIGNANGICDQKAERDGHKREVSHNIRGFPLCVEALHILLPGEDNGGIGCAEPGGDQVNGCPAGHTEQGAHHRLQDHAQKLHDTAVGEEGEDEAEAEDDADQRAAQIHHGAAGIDRGDELRAKAEYHHAGNYRTEDFGNQIEGCG